MCLAGLSTEEKALLRQSQKNSDELIKLNRQAFAIDLLYDEDYIKKKAKFMVPIEQLITQLETREQIST